MEDGVPGVKALPALSLVEVDPKIGVVHVLILSHLTTEMTAQGKLASKHHAMNKTVQVRVTFGM